MRNSYHIGIRTYSRIFHVYLLICIEQSSGLQVHDLCTYSSADVECGLGVLRLLGLPVELGIIINNILKICLQEYVTQIHKKNSDINISFKQLRGWR